MSAPYNGGPAFPREDYQTENDGGQCGMSLRDYFATAALPAILAQPEDGIQTWQPDATGGSAITAADAWARDAYKIADAMLAARETA